MALAAVVLVLTGCWRPAHGTVVIEPAPTLRSEVSLTYLGAGGWSIEAGGEMLLTAPLFSNPGPAAVLGGELDVKEEFVARQVRRFGLDRALGILVGHAHYDHAMDVPELAMEHARGATIYGSQTLAYQLAPWPGLYPGRVVPIDGRAATQQGLGTWTPVGTRFLFMPVESRHSNHTETVHMWQGERTEPMTERPVSAHDWLEGRTFSYVIDVLDDAGDPMLRILYNDSGSTFPVGYPPASMASTPALPVLAVLTAPGHKLEEEYPGRMLEYMAPEWVLAGHWEAFVMEWSENPQPMPLTDFGGFRKKMDTWDAGPWWAPVPGTRFVLRP